MDTKWIAKSKTFWGIVIAALPQALAVFDVQLGEDVLGQADAVVTQVISLAGLVLAFYGRVAAGGVWVVKKDA